MHFGVCQGVQESWFNREVWKLYENQSRKIGSLDRCIVWGSWNDERQIRSTGVFGGTDDFRANILVVCWWEVYGKRLRIHIK